MKAIDSNTHQTRKINFFTLTRRYNGTMEKHPRFHSSKMIAFNFMTARQLDVKMTWNNCQSLICCRKNVNLQQFRRKWEKPFAFYQPKKHRQENGNCMVSCICLHECSACPPAHNELLFLLSITQQEAFIFSIILQRALTTPLYTQNGMSSAAKQSALSCHQCFLFLIDFDW